MIGIERALINFENNLNNRRSQFQKTAIMPNYVYNFNSMETHIFKNFSLSKVENSLNKSFHGLVKSRNTLETEGKIIN